MDFQPYYYDSELSTVDLATENNLFAQYYNGPSNNGVKATLTVNGFGIIKIDGIRLRKFMTVLLKNQTNQNENGIYICIDEGSAITRPVLQRRDDFQCIEQIRAGQFFTVGKGETNLGKIFIVLDPIPLRFGIDPLFILDKSTDVIAASDVLLPSGNQGNEVYAFKSELRQTVEIGNDTNAKLGAILGRLTLNGVVDIQPGHLSGITGDLNFDSGNYQQGVLSGVLSTLNLAGTLPDNPTSVNGTQIYGFFCKFESFPNNPVNVQNLIGFGMINPSGQTIGSCMRFIGRANKFAEFDGATTAYFVTAGSGVGSAGDPTKCNADNVLVCSFDDVPCYIPIFNSNA